MLVYVSAELACHRTCAIIRPMPLPPPVTTATRPEISKRAFLSVDAIDNDAALKVMVKMKEF